jgi:cell wall-associated NlpC family hydrolase
MIYDSQIAHISALGAWEMKANAIIVTGIRYLGTPYRFGAIPGQTRNFDCSSFMQYIFGEYFIELPRVTRQQSRAGRQVSIGNIRKGDLLFFSTSKRRNLTGIQRIGHVGVYIGNNKYLNSFSPSGVTITQLTASRRRAFITARRVISNL